jgi:succinate dehydrogenase / fumarate reductase cytochrome b subunit
MALTGLALCGFLIAHLSGNLLLFAGEQQFNEYAEKLHSLGPLLALAETGLFVVFMLHLGLALSTTAMNRAARGSSYEVKESKQEGTILSSGGASNWMFLTGVLVFIFLAFHITDLKFKVNPWLDYSPAMTGEDTANEFQVVRMVLSDLPHAAIYGIGLIALGIHLSHGVRSAFQSLGLSHPRWDGLIKVVGILFAWSIAAGFMSLILWAVLKK